MSPRDAILAAARGAITHRVQTADLMQSIDASRPAIYAALAELEREGALVRRGATTYSLPTTDDEKAAYVGHVLGELASMAQRLKAAAADAGETDLALHAADMLDRIHDLREGVTT
jgi:DNA-binding GntR family transcriptional regulator